MRNLEQAGALERVAVMQLPTRDAAAQFSAAIGLLFVDADHAYAAVSADLRAWSPRIAADGWVVLHDVGAWSGPTRAAADLLDAGFRRYAQSDTVLALRKPANGS